MKMRSDTIILMDLLGAPPSSANKYNTSLLSEELPEGCYQPQKETIG
jgi:hypothetical protein